MNSTKSSVLPTLRGFHYQILLGIEKCFELNEGQSIWFESDGDISIRGKAVENNEQIESKHFNKSNLLNDNHLNFWNTISNWLKDEFDHTQYASLILHTTQPTSETSKLCGWNNKTPDERLAIIKSIYDTRTDAEKTQENAKGVLKLQKNIFNDFTNETMQDILGKMFINDSSGDIDYLVENLPKKLIGIPEDNIVAYFEGIVGWVYGKANKNEWRINQQEFRENLIDLTSRYSRGKFIFPEFTGASATEFDLSRHQESLFVQKIKNIEHDDEIPEAVGNYAEFTNSLLEHLILSPKYKKVTEDYKKDLITSFRKKKKLSPLKNKNTSKLECAQILYLEFIDEPAEQRQGCETVPKPYKNGLIHNSMDDQEEQLNWEID